MKILVPISFPGLLTTNQDRGAVSFDGNRTVTRVILDARGGTAPSGAAATFKLVLDGAADSQTLSLPAGDDYAAVTIDDSGLTINADVVIGVRCLTPSGATDVTAFLEVEEIASDPADSGGWIVVTAAHVKSRLTHAEYNVVTKAALNDLSDLIGELISATTEDVRGSVRSGGMAVGPVGTIPASLLRVALAIIVYDLLMRTNTVRQLDPDNRRQKAAERAEDKLLDVAAGKYTVETPAEVTETSTRGVTHSAPTRNATREKLDGL
jgi:hypothetical protein